MYLAGTPNLECLVGEIQLREHKQAPANQCRTRRESATANQTYQGNDGCYRHLHQKHSVNRWSCNLCSQSHAPPFMTLGVGVCETESHHRVKSGRTSPRSVADYIDIDGCVQPQKRCNYGGLGAEIDYFLFCSIKMELIVISEN